MPGRHPSIKKPRIYAALRRKGYPKGKAARISNSMRAGRRRRGLRSRGRR